MVPFHFDKYVNTELLSNKIHQNLADRANVQYRKNQVFKILSSVHNQNKIKKIPQNILETFINKISIQNSFRIS